jgi:hypothetical protein
MARTSSPQKPENTTPIQVPEPAGSDGTSMSGPETGDNGSIPPPDARQQPSKFSRFKATDRVVRTTGEAAVVEVRKPEPGVFFRTHTDAEMYTPVWCFEQKAGGKRLYLIDPALLELPEIEGMTKRIVFAPYITQFGGLGVWPISIDFEEMAWIKSALYICEQARTRWVSAISVKKQNAYRHQYAQKDFGPPPWPVLDQEGLGISVPAGGLDPRS